MKVKSFNTYLEKRLDKKEIKEIKDAAKVEFEIFTALQEEVAKTLVDFTAAVVQRLMVASVSNAHASDVTYTSPDSDSGSRHALATVGSAANESATTAAPMATVPSLVRSHAAVPPSDSAPHTQSAWVVLQLPWLLRSEALKTRSGTKPAMKVIRATRPMPASSSAAKASNGARAHRSQVTRCGWVRPVSVSRR